MAGFNHANLRGSIFKNENPRSERSPHYSGSAKIDSKTFRVVGWDSDRHPGMITLHFEDELDAQERREQAQRTQEGAEQTGDYLSQGQAPPEQASAPLNCTRTPNCVLSPGHAGDCDDMPF